MIARPFLALALAVVAAASSGCSVYLTPESRELLAKLPAQPHPAGVCVALKIDAPAPGASADAMRDAVRGAAIAKLRRVARVLTDEPKQPGPLRAVFTVRPPTDLHWGPLFLMMFTGLWVDDIPFHLELDLCDPALGWRTERLVHLECDVTRHIRIFIPLPGLASPFGLVQLTAFALAASGDETSDRLGEACAQLLAEAFERRPELKTRGSAEAGR